MAHEWRAQALKRARLVQPGAWTLDMWARGRYMSAACGAR